jgi:hypothetical protein
MRNNKAILDEAARSVRRTFVGSVAGSIGMLAVVGAAGAYGMPEKLTTQALAAAMARLNMKFPTMEHAVPATERPVQVADNAKLRAMSPLRSRSNRWSQKHCQRSKPRRSEIPSQPTIQSPRRRSPQA